jgi:hypothetical protein
MALNLINAKLTQKTLLIAHLLRSNIKIINFLGHGAAVTEKRPKALCAVAIFYFSFPRPLGVRRAGISAAECKLAKGADCHSAQAPIANSKKDFHLRAQCARAECRLIL